ncbi:serine protease easter-like [Orussus abietinus]|uniref:serine protease easter-like n=1 Tax=Orussus abietinus TaxID=222816 RepID=UPI0006267E89|nr:serine protease easter-like [Orussus abietinus]
METLSFRLLLSQVLVCLASAQSWTPRQLDCYSPTRQPGQCIGIRECPPLLSLLQSRPLNPQNVDFLRQSQCGFEGRDPKVCCVDPRSNTGNVPTTTSGATDEQKQDVQSKVNLQDHPLLPKECGRDLSQRIVGGEKAGIDEFPWMALLEYDKPNGRVTACGGVLISDRYVLTAAHCLKGKDLPRTWRLSSVRLGEYNTETEHDCIADGEDSQVCADDPISVGIEEHIAHEDYVPQSRDQRFDIALLRLTRSVSFTNFIKPICLPSDESLGPKLVVAGWGKTETKTESNIKLKLTLPLADGAECNRTYGNAGVRLGGGQICAGGQRGKDSCRGDSGGPLMSFQRSFDGTGRWAVVGIVSFGPSPCGMQGWPGVYTKVDDYTPWVLRNLRA